MAKTTLERMIDHAHKYPFLADKYFEREVPKANAEVAVKAEMAREKLLKDHVINLTDFREKFEVRHAECTH